MHDRLSPVKRIEPEQFAKLAHDLDSDEYSVRESATRRFEECGESVVTELQKLINDHQSLEVRRRVQQILVGFKSTELSPSQLRVVRLVQVLELMESPDAQTLLKSLAKGAPDARLTKDANAALERIAKRPELLP